MDNRSILLIDNNEVDNFIFEKFVAQSDVKVKIHAFVTAESAIEFLREGLQNSQLPEMIFLDLNLPGMSGWDFLEEFRKLRIRKEIVLFLLTASAYPKDEEESKKYPEVNGFLIKPLAREKLLELMHRFL